jgi:ABC-type sulfate transport system permease component
VGERVLENLVIGFVVPPLITGIWLLFVLINNRWAEKSLTGSRIEPHPWANLFKMYLVSLVLTLFHIFQR